MRPIEGNNVDAVGLCREFGKACVYENSIRDGREEQTGKLAA
jgi:hypothetical protein